MSRGICEFERYGIDTLVTPETILRWYRQLIAKKYDGSRNEEWGDLERGKRFGTW
ncbi:MAG: hypothetical protein HN350_13260 [Phycisphaerales bacterium]|jgi:hypothetical protein|nr:hypothetical protein [Phycisphaerales bacterium]